jgi:small subunit ribosomal protein S4e
MANMGSRKHLKRFKSPKTWPIHQKENKWTVKPAAGPHTIKGSLPLMIVVRDILGIADNSREAKTIINNGEVLVDGRVRKDYKFPVGFMDVIQIPKNNGVYRILSDSKGRLLLHEIKEENSEFKLCKVEKISLVKGGKIQLGLHDGRNVLTEETLKVGDVVKLQVPDQEILENIAFEEGNIGLVTGGKHTGEIGTIKEINITKSSMSNTVVIETNDNTFLTLKDYVFVIGNEEPIISLPGGN